MIRRRCIYKITNLVNNKCYIGSTIDYYTRKKSHISKLNRNKSCSKILQYAWNKYGKDNFEFEVIEEVGGMK